MLDYRAQAPFRESMEKHPVFYISSRGHTATTWLSRIICRHERFVCWHGVRRIPPVETEFNGYARDLSPEAFMDGLISCSENTEYAKIFGALHGYHGISAKKACEARGGLFSAIFRHPIARINSLCHLNLGLALFPEENGDTVQRRAREIMPLAAELLGGIQVQAGGRVEYQSDQPRQVLAARLLKEFFQICAGTIDLDLENFANTPDSARIVMEEMVASEEYFHARVWPNVSLLIAPTRACLENAFSGDKVNSHAGISKAVADIYAGWPDHFKSLFNLYLDQKGRRPVLAMYHHFGYSQFGETA